MTDNRHDLIDALKLIKKYRLTHADQVDRAIALVQKIRAAGGIEAYRRQNK